MSTPLVEVHPDADALATAVAGELLNRLADAQAAGHQPQIALTGGSVSETLHRELARLSPASEVDWTRVVVWWGDDRYVPADDPDRNAGQARRAFLDEVGATQVHEMPASDGGLDVGAAALAFEEVVHEHGRGEFEVVMLGIGPDGHVASLFPGRPELDVVDQILVGVSGAPKPPPERISFTFPALNRSRSVWVIASGEGKAEAVAAALADTGSVTDTPARGVHGLADTTYFLDRAAASHL